MLNLPLDGGPRNFSCLQSGSNVPTIVISDDILPVNVTLIELRSIAAVRYGYSRIPTIQYISEFDKKHCKQDMAPSLSELVLNRYAHRKVERYRLRLNLCQLSTSPLKAQAGYGVPRLHVCLGKVLVM